MRVALREAVANRSPDGERIVRRTAGHGRELERRKVSERAVVAGGMAGEPITER